MYENFTAKVEEKTKDIKYDDSKSTDNADNAKLIADYAEAMSLT